MASKDPFSVEEFEPLHQERRVLMRHPLFRWIVVLCSSIALLLIILHWIPWPVLFIILPIGALISLRIAGIIMYSNAEKSPSTPQYQPPVQPAGWPDYRSGYQVQAVNSSLEGS